MQGLLAEIGLGYLLPNPGVPLLVCCIHVINPPPQILTPKRMSTFPELPPHNKQVARAHYTRCCSCNVPFFGISILGKQTYLPSHAPASPFQGLPASTTTRAHPAHLHGMHYRTQENRAFSKRSRATKWFLLDNFGGHTAIEGAWGLVMRGLCKSRELLASRHPCQVHLRWLSLESGAWAAPWTLFSSLSGEPD